MSQDIQKAVERLSGYVAALQRVPVLFLIDDEETDLIHLEKAIRETGVEVETDSTSSGAVALSSLEQVQFDLIFLDLRMAPIDGLDIIKRLPDVNKDTPIVTLSGHDNGPLVNEALSLGVWLHLRKPINQDHLKTILGKVKLT